MARQRQQVGPEGGEVDRDTSDGLRRVDVHEHATVAAPLDDLGDGLQRADLVVAPLDVDDRGRVVDPVEQLVGIDPTEPVDADGEEPPSLGPLAHRRVLHERGDDAVTGTVARQRAVVCGGDRLGGAGGEHDLSGSGSDQLGELLTGHLECDPCDHALVVDPPGVGAEVAPSGVEVLEHRGEGDRPDGRGRRVVQIGAPGHAQAGSSNAVTQWSSPPAVALVRSTRVSP